MAHIKKKIQTERKRSGIKDKVKSSRKTSGAKHTGGVDLFETPQKIPVKVRIILDKYEAGFEDGDYKTLNRAKAELEKIGYTFDYYLDGVAYDLRKIGEMGKIEYSEKILTGTPFAGGRKLKDENFYKEGSNKWGLGNTEIYVIENEDGSANIYDSDYDEAKGWHYIEVGKEENLVDAKKFALDHAKKQDRYLYSSGSSMVSGGSVETDAKYVAIGDKGGFWTVISKPTTHENAKWYADNHNVRGEIGRVVTLEEAKEHKGVLGKEYLSMASGGGVGRGFKKLSRNKYGNAYKITEWQGKKYLTGVPLMKDGSVGSEEEEYDVDSSAFNESEAVEFKKDMINLFGKEVLNVYPLNNMHRGGSMATGGGVEHRASGSAKVWSSGDEMMKDILPIELRYVTTKEGKKWEIYEGNKFLGKKKWKAINSEKAEEILKNYTGDISFEGEITRHFNLLPKFSSGGSMESGGPIDDKIESIYKKYSEKDYWGQEENLKLQIQSWKNAVERGDKNAIKYTEQDIIDNSERLQRKGFDWLVNKTKQMIADRDVKELKGRIRYDQKVMIDIYEALTGTSLKGMNNKQLADYFDKTYGGGSMCSGGLLEDETDTIDMDVPLFIRMLEYSREDAKTDMDLHRVTENAIEVSKSKSPLKMEDYDSIIKSGSMASGGEIFYAIVDPDTIKNAIKYNGFIYAIHKDFIGKNKMGFKEGDLIYYGEVYSDKGEFITYLPPMKKRSEVEDRAKRLIDIKNRTTASMEVGGEIEAPINRLKSMASGGGVKKILFDPKKKYPVKIYEYLGGNEKEKVAFGENEVSVGDIFIKGDVYELVEIEDYALMLVPSGSRPYWLDNPILETEYFKERKDLGNPSVSEISFTSHGGSMASGGKTEKEQYKGERFNNAMEPIISKIIKDKVGNNKNEFIRNIRFQGASKTPKKLSVALNNQYNYDIIILFEYDINGNLKKSRFIHQIKEWEYSLDDIEEVGGFEGQKKVLTELAKEIGVALAKNADKYFSGGSMATGGGIPNNYKGKNIHQVWDAWTVKQRAHFLSDHEAQIKSLMFSNPDEVNITIEQFASSKFDNLPFGIQDALAVHIVAGQYKNGGLMESGGATPVADEMFPEDAKILRDKYNANLRKYDSLGGHLEDAIEEGDQNKIKKIKEEMREIESKIHRYERGYDSGGRTEPKLCVGDIYHLPNEEYYYTIINNKTRGGGSYSYQSDKNGKPKIGARIISDNSWLGKKPIKVGHIDLEQVTRNIGGECYQYYKSGNKELDIEMANLDARWSAFVKNASKAQRAKYDKQEDMNYHHENAQMITDWFDAHMESGGRMSSGGKTKGIEFIDGLKINVNDIYQVGDMQYKIIDVSRGKIKYLTKWETEKEWDHNSVGSLSYDNFAVKGLFNDKTRIYPEGGKKSKKKK